MSADKQNTFNVKPFDGNGFSNWEFRIQLLLEQQNVLEVTKSLPPADADKLEKFKKDDVKARMLIIQCVADNILEMLKTKKTAKEIMESLRNTYVRTGISNQIILQKKFRELKFDRSGMLATFFTEFDQTVCELKSAGGNVSDEEIVLQLLASMPEEYSSITTAIDVIFSQDQNKVSLELVKNKLIMEEARQSKHKHDEGAVFHSGTKNSNKVKFPFKCHYCGIIGHKRSECRKEKKDKNSRSSKGYESKQKSVATTVKQDDEEIVFLTSECNDHVNLIDEKICFVVDSGATQHLMNEKYMKLLTDQKIINNSLSVAKEGEKLQAIKSGNLKLCTTNGMNILMKDVWICKGIICNLLSVAKLEETGLSVVFKNKVVQIWKTDKLIAEGKLEGKLYKVEFYPRDRVNLCKENEMELLHRKMGHSSKYPSNGICEVCIKSKQTRLPFKSVSTEQKAKSVLEIVSSDVCGPITPSTYDGKNYMVTFIDHFSHFTVCYLIESKSEVLKKFEEYVELVKTKFQKNVKSLRCDNGGEYTSKRFKDLCKKNGIEIKYTIPYNPENNGVAERLNRTILEKARCLIFDANVEKYLWGEAVLCSVYLLNRTTTTQLNGKTPADIWYNDKPNLNKIKLFGCTAYNLVPKECRSGKLDSHSQKLKMVGYTNNGYRLWDSNTKQVICGRNIIFDENPKITKIHVQEEELQETRSKKNEDRNLEEENKNSEEDEVPDSNEKENEVNNRRSSRKSKIPSRFEDYELNLMAALSAGILPEEVPNTYEEAIQDEGWKNAIQEELKTIESQETWDIVDRPNGKNLIDSKWVFREKMINGVLVKKARLVARGCKQNELQEEVYSPVARMVTIRLLFALYVENNLKLTQMDVKSAFLYGILESPIYMEVPKGVSAKNLSNKICKLKKALYGLRDAPKCWNDMFNNVIVKLGFKRSKKDPCLYISEGIYLLLYVDDLLIFSKSCEKLENLKENLLKNFKMTEVKNNRLTFLGLEITLFENRLIISQKNLIEKILKRFDMTNCKTRDIPIPSKLYLSGVNNEFNEELPYRELIGCLMYIMLGSRPDLCYAISYFSRFQNSYNSEHWRNLKNVLKYLNKTKDYGLEYVKSNIEECMIHAYVDSDFANDPVDRKSVTGCIVKLNKNAIFWQSKKQNIVAMSSTEAEYVALSTCIMETFFLSHIIAEMKNEKFCITVYEDNQSCIKMSSTLETKRSKHIDTKYHFVRDCVLKKEVKLKYIESSKQLADLCTKPLDRIKFGYFCKMLNLGSIN